jgi:hypothetical protein
MRSVSGNIYAGGDASAASVAGAVASGPIDLNNVITAKLTQMINPSPSSTFIYLDEQADSINDSAFFSPWGGKWYDLPASYHNGAGGLSFGDGHSEIHKWQASVATVKVTAVSSFSGLNVATTDLDYVWLRDRVQHK